jgi:hypothetical protein
VRLPDGRLHPKAIGGPGAKVTKVGVDVLVGGTQVQVTKVGVDVLLKP